MAIPKLGICGIFQVLVAIPFLRESWRSYLIRSFDFGRQFMHKWTVNWRFVPEDIFLSKTFSRSLLFAHAVVLAFFAFRKWTTRSSVFGIVKIGAKKTGAMKLEPDYIVFVMFSCNLIGIAFTRSLHYQFYVWYYHTVPFLLWKTNLHVSLRVFILILIEISWNTYPSTNISSVVLIICHLFILLQLAFIDYQIPQKKNQKQ